MCMSKYWCIENKGLEKEVNRIIRKKWLAILMKDCETLNTAIRKRSESGIINVLYKQTLKQKLKQKYIRYMKSSSFNQYKQRRRKKRKLI